MKRDRVFVLLLTALWTAVFVWACPETKPDVPIQNTENNTNSGTGENPKHQEVDPTLNFILIPGGTVTGVTHPDVDSAATEEFKGVFIDGRTVTLSSFYMCDHEVTQQEYEKVMSNRSIPFNGVDYTLDATPSGFKYLGAFDNEQASLRPVDRVSWYDAVYYCNMLSDMTGLTAAYHLSDLKADVSGHITAAEVTLVPDANGYRLPTEAEWEYAARGGDPSAPEWNYLFSGAPKAKGSSYADGGNSGMDSVGWYGYNNRTGKTTELWQAYGDGDGTHQVKMRQPNRLGLYDMSGNVSEWCWDYYDTISAETVTDPTGPTNPPATAFRVHRGESIQWDAFTTTVCYRKSFLPAIGTYLNGFRVVRSAQSE